MSTSCVCAGFVFKPPCCRCHQSAIKTSTTPLLVTECIHKYPKSGLTIAHRYVIFPCCCSLDINRWEASWTILVRNSVTKETWVQAQKYLKAGVKNDFIWDDMWASFAYVPWEKHQHLYWVLTLSGAGVREGFAGSNYSPHPPQEIHIGKWGHCPLFFSLNDTHKSHNKCIWVLFLECCDQETVPCMCF